MNKDLFAESERKTVKDHGQVGTQQERPNADPSQQAEYRQRHLHQQENTSDPLGGRLSGSADSIGDLDDQPKR